jgi:hypothetical protein
LFCCRKQKNDVFEEDDAEITFTKKGSKEEENYWYRNRQKHINDEKKNNEVIAKIILKGEPWTD